MKVFIYSLNSCGMRNTVIQRYRDYLSANDHELVDGAANSDVILVWTCGFRGDVRDNSLEQLITMAEKNSSEVVAAGCVPDIDRELLNRHFPGRVIPWRNHEQGLEELFGPSKVKLTDVPLVLSKPQMHDDEGKIRRENPEADVPYVGRYVQVYISEGCLWDCTYCSERLAFPPYRSFDEDQIVQACRGEVERSGTSAVVLLGDSVGDYGTDTGSSLPALIRRLKAEVPALRLALQDLNPLHFLKFYDDMVEFIRTGFIAHLQIPYQSASDRILKLMKRPYGRADIEKVFGTLNDLGFTELDSHMIVGFPGETEADHELSLGFALEYRPKYMLVNGYMESPNAPAAKLPGKVDWETKHRRIREAERRLKEGGIMCNADNSDFASERFRRMNRPELPNPPCR